MQGTFYIIGTGPGDPELLTIKAKRILEECRIWFIPSAFKEDKKSLAYTTAAAVVSPAGKRVITHYFPMKKIPRGEEAAPEIREAWEKGAKHIMEHLANGEDVVFPSMGDPTIYSAAFYICETLQEFGSPFPIKIIPGVSSLGATAAEAQIPLCLGDERLVLIPATFTNEKIIELLAQVETAVFMKVDKVMKRLIPLLEELNLIDNAVLIERCSLEDQRIWRDIRQAADEKLHYFTTLIVRSKKEGKTLA